MANISTWSTTAANNNSNPPDGWPENMAPSAVNDAAREMMASVRTWYEDAEWTNFGYTHTYASGTSFTIAGADYTTEYHVGRRLRAVGSSTGTIYGTITASSFSTNTTVTIAWDSGSLSNESLTVSLAALSANNSAMPGVEISEDDWTHQGNVTIEGTATVGGSSVAVTVTTTRGDLIRRGASADERVALGTSGHVLTSDGTDAVWSAPVNTWEDLGTTTFSNTAEYELALSATYREYRLVVEELLPATNDQGLVATVSDGSYKSSGYMYSVLRQTSTTIDAVASGSAASILLTFTGGLGNVDGEESFGEILIKGHQNSGGQCQITSHLVLQDGGTPEQYWGQGRYLTDGAITAVKLAMESGNFTSGKITAYGLRA